MPKRSGCTPDGREIQLGRFSQGMNRVFSAFDIQGAVPSSEILKVKFLSGLAAPDPTEELHRGCTWIRPFFSNLKVASS